MAVVIGPLIGIVIVVLGIDWMIRDSRIKAYNKKLRKYIKISIGMSEEEVVYLLGDRFKRSLLRDGSTLYTYGIYNKRALSRYLNIYFRDGRVEEVDASHL